MAVFLASSAGFCVGVEMAVKGVYNNLDKKRMVTYGPIIHNNHVINDLKKHNVDIINNIEEVEENSTVVIRTHGVPPSVYENLKENKIDYIDYTCPFVKKIHRIAKKEYENGANIIIVGDASHPEIIGIDGFTRQTSIIVHTEEEAEKVTLDSNKKYSVVVQTTFKDSNFNKIVEILKSKSENIEVFNTICSATQDRQRAAEELSKEMDYMIVLGDKKSSNSTKLYEICKKNCEKTYFVQNIDEIQLKNINKYDKIGITAGASTPSDIIQEAIRKMTLLTEEIENDETGENFEKMLEESFKPLHSGEVVKGIVISVSEREITVNLGSKSDGIVTRSEVTEDEDIDIRTLFKAGDEIEVYVSRINDGEGNVVLSHKRINEQKNLNELGAYFESSEIVKGKIIDTVRGGLIALIKGVRAFVPASQISARYTSDLSGFKGKEFDFKIIEFDAEKRRVLAGRRDIAVKEEEAARKEFIRNLKPGEEIKGVVRHIENFGAFVNLGEVDGLIHISEISWSRGKKVFIPFKVGDTIKVRVLEANEDLGRISLSYRATIENPWDNAEERYFEGAIVKGRVARMTDFGAFIELEDGIDGLVHISAIALKRINKPEDVLKIGEEIEAKVTSLDKETQRVSLSIKALLEEEVLEA